MAIAALSLLSVGFAFQLPEPPSVFDAQGKRAGFVATAAQIERARTLVDKPFPRVTVTDLSGRKYVWPGAAKKLTVLVFIEPGCACCDAAKRYFDRIQTAYGDVALVLGLVYGSKVQAQQWKAAHRPRFSVGFDSQGEAARALRAEVGLAIRLLDRKGRVAISDPGYSAASLRELGSRIGALAKIKVRPIATSPAPDTMAAGCPLGSHPAK